MNSNDKIIETVNEELAAASLAEQLGSSAHECFIILGSNMQPLESETGPRAKKVSEEGQRMLTQCISYLCEIRQSTIDAMSTIQEIVDVDLKVVEGEENAMILNQRIREKFTTTQRTYPAKGKKELQQWQLTVRNFQYDHIRPSLKEIGGQVVNDQATEKTLQNRQTDVRDIEPLKPGDVWTSLASFLTNLPIKKAVRIVSSKIGKKIVAIRKEVECGSNEVHVLKTIEESTERALERLEDTIAQWIKVQNTIWSVVAKRVPEILSKNPRITSHVKELIQEILTRVLNELAALYLQINNSWAEVSVAYGDNRSMARETQVFYHGVDGVSDHLKRLLFAADIVHDKRAEDVRKFVRALGTSLAEQLEKLKNIFSEWIACLHGCPVGTNLEMIPQIGDIMSRNSSFERKAHTVCNEIREILGEEVSSWKSRQALAKQKREDEVNAVISKPNERRAATSAEGLQAVQKMEGIIDVISKFSVELGMGMLFHRQESYSTATLEDSEEPASKTSPLDPYTVDETLIVGLSCLIGNEIFCLERLTREDDKENSPA